MMDRLVRPAPSQCPPFEVSVLEVNPPYRRDSPASSAASEKVRHESVTDLLHH